MTSNDGNPQAPRPTAPLRRGWTTGACAAAATRAACELLRTGQAPAQVEIALPGGNRVAFAVAMSERGPAAATAGVVKDAGDDPDVTHGVLVKSSISPAEPGRGVIFRAGPGVGTVTRPGLPVLPGEPAINPVPREMIRAAVADAAAAFGGGVDVVVEISIPGGEAIAQRTLNPRLGIVGGLSVLGTTGIVVPYSCAAWIDSIHRGIDVARAMAIAHVAGSTGSTSELAVQRLYALPDVALIEMGDFVGGMLKYLRRHPVPRVTIAGGFAKLTKLGQGLLDLHSKRGEVDRAWLAALLADAGAASELCAAARNANTALHVLELARSAGLPLADLVARAALVTAARALDCPRIALDVVVVDRAGEVIGRAGSITHPGAP